MKDNNSSGDELLTGGKLFVVFRIPVSEPCLPISIIPYFCSFFASKSTWPRILPFLDIASLITLTECSTVE
jgi:hypothetical protein